MRMTTKFIFDVDGTLTPSRGFIDSDFKSWFNIFATKYPVMLVTGSDKPKTVEQIGEDTYNLCHTVYNCSGADVWQSNKNIRQSNWTFPSMAHEWLCGKLEESSFPLRTGLHFEHRIGLVNFSIVGRNADQQQRAEYVEWDTKSNERNRIAQWFNQLFTGLEARPGGETGIDITPKGGDKSQILSDFSNDTKLVFFGDRMDLDGNDYPLSKAIVDNNQGVCYNVSNWQDTWEKLKTLCPDV